MPDAMVQGHMSVELVHVTVVDTVRTANVTDQPSAVEIMMLCVECKSFTIIFRIFNCQLYHYLLSVSD